LVCIFNQQKPACELVETAYGRWGLAGNAGLYFVATLGQKVKMEKHNQATDNQEIPLIHRPHHSDSQ
jgi:hypothetical protein